MRPGDRVQGTGDSLPADAADRSSPPRTTWDATISAVRANACVGVREGGLRAVVAANSFACLLLTTIFAFAAPAVAQPPALSPREVDTAARLLRLEDRREYDEALLESAARGSGELRR